MGRLDVACSDIFRYDFLFSVFTGETGRILNGGWKNGQTADMDTGTDGESHDFAGCVRGGKGGIGGTGNTDRRASSGRRTGEITEQDGAGFRSFRASECSEA